MTDGPDAARALLPGPRLAEPDRLGRSDRSVVRVRAGAGALIVKEYPPAFRPEATRGAPDCRPALVGVRGS